MKNENIVVDIDTIDIDKLVIADVNSSNFNIDMDIATGTTDTDFYLETSYVDTDLLRDIQNELLNNNNKLSSEFIDSVADKAEVIYLHPTDATRICILQLRSGHEVLGYAQVLDPKNDDESIGNSVAYNNAKGELWQLCGSIAKVFI